MGRAQRFQARRPAPPPQGAPRQHTITIGDALSTAGCNALGAAEPMRDIHLKKSFFITPSCRHHYRTPDGTIVGGQRPWPICIFSHFLKTWRFPAAPSAHFPDSKMPPPELPLEIFSLLQYHELGGFLCGAGHRHRRVLEERPLAA